MCTLRLGVRRALLAVRADAGVRPQALRLAAGALAALRVALALAGVPGRHALAVLAGQALDREPLTIDDDGDGVPPALAHPPDHLHATRVAVLDGHRAGLADPGLAQSGLRALVETADLAADLRRRHGLRLLRDRRDLLLVLAQQQGEVEDLLRGQRLDLGDGFVGGHLFPF